MPFHARAFPLSVSERARSARHAVPSAASSAEPLARPSRRFLDRVFARKAVTSSNCELAAQNDDGASSPNCFFEDAARAEASKRRTYALASFGCRLLAGPSFLGERCAWVPLLRKLRAPSVIEPAYEKRGAPFVRSDSTEDVRCAAFPRRTADSRASGCLGRVVSHDTEKKEPSSPADRPPSDAASEETLPGECRAFGTACSA